MVSSVHVGESPDSAAYDSGNGYDYVVSQWTSGAWPTGIVSIINGTTVIGSISLQGLATSVTYDPGNGYIYVSNGGGLVVINGTKVIGGVGVLEANDTNYCFAGFATYDIRNDYIYAPVDGCGRVAVVNGTSLVGWVYMAGTSSIATFNDGNGYIYVPNYASNTLSVVNGTRTIGVVEVGSNPSWGAYDGRNGYIYVPNANSHNVSVVNGTRVIGTVNVGSSPCYSSYDDLNGYVYVMNCGSANVSVINGTTVVGTVKVGTDPWSATLDIRTGWVYVANHGSANVTVINGANVAATVTVGSEPIYPSYDAGLGLVYVPNYGSGNVSVLFTRGGGYSAGFTEIGLPTGTGWWVNVTGGPSTYSNKSALSLVEGNGTYSYSVTSTDPAYASLPGSFTIKGAATSSSVAFIRVPDLSLSIAAVPMAICGNDSTRCAAGVGESLVTLTAGSPANGSAAVVANGTAQPIFQFISFGEIRLVPGQRISVSCLKADGTYFTLCDATPIVFTRNGTTGLAWNWSTGPTSNRMYAGDLWTVSFLVYSAGPPYGTVPVDACVTPSCLAGGSTAVNGLFTCARYGTPANSTVVVRSFPEAQIDVEMANASYSVTFKETGLPSRTIWVINLSGTIRASASSSMIFSEPNGSYRYWVQPVVGFAVRASSRAFTVNGTDQSVSILFEPTYPVVVAETGLPPGSEWMAYLGFDQGDSRSSSISFSELNGTYPPVKAGGFNHFQHLLLLRTE